MKLKKYIILCFDYKSYRRTERTKTMTGISSEKDNFKILKGKE